MKYVVIGNSAAAIGAVEGIRQIDTKGEITLISNEKYHTYSRPLISYLLLGKTDHERMKYRENDFYEKNNCSLVFGEVTKVNSEKKTIVLADGTEFAYDKLLVATGSSSFIPNIKGLERVKNKFTFSSLEDAMLLDKAITNDSKVLIVGAGLIGLKCAEGISKKVNSVLVDLSPRVLSSILDEDGSFIIKEHLESKGMEFYLGDTITELTENRAYLKSGTQIDFDILVLAVGVRANVNLIKEIGGRINQGILVNEKSETSLPDIYAAGDCTESYDISSDEYKVMALLPNAYIQGNTAGINMAGRSAEFDKAIPMNAIGFFGKHIISAGTYSGLTYESKGNGSYKKLFYGDNVLKGYILIGDIDKAGIYTSLIKEKTPLDSIDFNLICEKPSLLAFSKEKRQEKLGGE